MSKPYERLSCEQGSAEWKAERLRRVTASNVAAVLGISQYKTALEYFDELTTGIEPEVSGHKQTLFEIGHKAEIKGREYAEGYYGSAFPPAVLISTKCQDLMASLDGFSEEHNVIFEAKYAGRDTISKMRSEPGWIRPDHEAQVQAQLLVSGAVKCVYFAMDPDGEAAVAEVLPSVEYHERISQAVAAFMLDLRAGKAPEPTDRDWHTPVDEGFKTLVELKAIADEAAARYDDARKALVEKYKSYARVRSSGVMLYRSYVSGNVDYSKIEALKSIDLDAYRKPGRVQYNVKIEKKGGTL